MTYRVVLGTPDSSLVAEVRALAEEGAEIELVASAGSPEELGARLEDTGAEAVLLHEDLGPLAITDLARQLSATHPQVGFVLLVREETPELLRSSLQAGVRDVLSSPLTLERLQTSVRNAATWAQTVRESISADGSAAAAERAAGNVVAVAGAKGGTGTTTVALQLALMSAVADREHSVCLADLDLQTGDVRTLLDLPDHRSIADLAGIADDVSPRSLEDTLYVHESGLRVLLAPEEGEGADDIDGVAARQILGALRFQHDLVVVDVGSVMTQAATAVIELAERALVVATPDVLALRGANRLLRLWRRLEVRQENVSVVLNRVSRNAEVQPDLARKVSLAPLAKTAIPAGFRDLEAAINTGVPGRLGQGAVRQALGGLAKEMGVLPETQRWARRLVSQAGQAAVETTGLVWVIGVVILVVWQIVLVAYTFVIAGHAARSSAHALAIGAPSKPPATKDVPGAWRGGLKFTKDTGDGKREAYAQVSLAVPVLIPGLDTPFHVTARESTVIEGQALPKEVSR